MKYVDLTCLSFIASFVFVIASFDYINASFVFIIASCVYRFLTGEDTFSLSQVILFLAWKVTFQLMADVVAKWL